MSEFKGDRLAKVIARAGIASRRDAEKLIAAGRVVVNGKVVTSPAVNVTDADTVTVDGQALAEPERPRLWRYHKPAGLVTSHRDEKGRRTVFDAVSGQVGRVISVGRLDLNSEGLLLLTNDGELARALELPASGWVRRYKVRVHKEPMPPTLAKLARGITVDGVRYEPIKAEVDKGGAANVWLNVAIKEGKNREIRRVFEHFDHPVSRLIRTAYGPFQLGRLTKGMVEEIPSHVARDQLGRELAEKFFPKAKRRGKDS